MFVLNYTEAFAVGICLTIVEMPFSVRWFIFFFFLNFSSEMLIKTQGHWSIGWLNIGTGKVDKIWLNIMDLSFSPSYVLSCASWHVHKCPFFWNSALFLLPFIILGKVPLDETFVVLRLPARVQTLYFWHWGCRFPEAT